MDFDINLVTKNLNLKVKPVEKMTIETLNDTNLDGAADETFDPDKVEFGSDDEIENLEGSDDEESVDEEIEKVLKEKAIQIAKSIKIDAKKEKTEISTRKSKAEKLPEAKTKKSQLEKTSKPLMKKTVQTKTQLKKKVPKGSPKVSPKKVVKTRKSKRV